MMKLKLTWYKVCLFPSNYIVSASFLHFGKIQIQVSNNKTVSN